MRLPSWFGVVATFALVLGACGGQGHKAAQPTPEQLGAVLLTAGDLGAGWSEQQRDVFTTRAPENPSIDPSLWCPAASQQSDALQKLAGQAGADVELQSEQVARNYRGIRQQAWSNGDVAKYFETAVSAVKTCSGATWTDADGNKYSAEALQGPPVGDESANWSVVTVVPTPAGDKISRSRQTVARFGTTLMVLQQGDMSSADNEPLFSEADAQKVISTAGAKLATLANV